MEQNGHTNHSAIGPLAGFAYQDFFFLFKLLTIQPEERVSFELFEDVGVEGCDKRTYYQQKHTIKGNENNPIKMTKRDNDLWKTLSVWIDILSQKGTDTEQMSWIKNSKFVLLSNKDATNNELWKKIQDFQKNIITFEELELFIKNLCRRTDDSISKEGKEIAGSDKNKKIEMLLDYPLREEFLRNVFLEFKTDQDIIEDIRHIIRYQKHTPENNVHACMAALLGELKCQYLKTIQKGKALEFDEVSFDKIFGSYFNVYKERKFVPLNRNIEIPSESYETTFLKQLIEVNYLKASDTDTKRDYLRFCIDFSNSYNHALEFTGEQGRKSFEREVKQRWRHHFNKKNFEIEEGSSEKTILQAARNVVYGVMEEDLNFENDPLSRTASNGCFFYFSDGESPKIGWRYDWKNRYNGSEWIIE